MMRKDRRFFDHRCWERTDVSLTTDAEKGQTFLDQRCLERADVSWPKLLRKDRRYLTKYRVKGTEQNFRNEPSLCSVSSFRLSPPPPPSKSFAARLSLSTNRFLYSYTHYEPAHECPRHAWIKWLKIHGGGDAIMRDMKNQETRGSHGIERRW